MGNWTATVPPANGFRFTNLMEIVLAASFACDYERYTW